MTPKQERFCREYLIDLNGTQAAIRAGYSKKTAGAQAEKLLKKPEMQAMFIQLRDQQSKRIDRTADEVIQRLWKIVEADVRKAFNDEGVALPPSQIPDDLAGALAGLKIGENIEYKLNDRLKALELLGKYHALFTDKVQTEVTQTARVMIMLPDNGRDPDLTKGTQDGNG